MATGKIQSGDKVLITAGNYKGTEGVVTKVLKIIKYKYGKAYMIKRAEVSNVPTIVKYRRAVTYNGKDYPGTQTFVNRKLNISNLSLVTADGKRSKVSIKIENDKKQRYLKKDDSLIVREKIISKKNNTENLETLKSKELTETISKTEKNNNKSN